MASDPEFRAHQEWLGFLQPIGLVVSTPALLATQTYVQRNIIPEQQVLLGLVHQAKIASSPMVTKKNNPLFRTFLPSALNFWDGDRVTLPAVLEILNCPKR